MSDFPISWSLFRRVFGTKGAIRVKFSWEESAVTSISLWTGPEIPPEWYLVWYSKSEGTGRTPARHNDSGARPLSVGEASADLARLGDQRADVVARVARQMRCQSNAPIVVATWCTPNGRRLMLDGNHRAVASRLVSKHGPVFAFTLHGPPDPRVIPDLKHHRWPEQAIRHGILPM